MKPLALKPYYMTIPMATLLFVQLSSQRMCSQQTRDYAAIMGDHEDLPSGCNGASSNNCLFVLSFFVDNPYRVPDAKLYINLWRLYRN